MTFGSSTLRLHDDSEPNEPLPEISKTTFSDVEERIGYVRTLLLYDAENQIVGDSVSELETTGRISKLFAWFFKGSTSINSDADAENLKREILLRREIRKHLIKGPSDQSSSDNSYRLNTDTITCTHVMNNKRKYMIALASTIIMGTMVAEKTRRKYFGGKKVHPPIAKAVSESGATDSSVQVTRQIPSTTRFLNNKNLISSANPSKLLRSYELPSSTDDWVQSKASSSTPKSTGSSSDSLTQSTKPTIPKSKKPTPRSELIEGRIKYQDLDAPSFKRAPGSDERIKKGLEAKEKNKPKLPSYTYARGTAQPTVIVHGSVNGNF